MAKWAEHFKINKSTFKSQIRKGWSISKILQRSVRRNKRIYRGIINKNKRVTNETLSRYN